MIAGLQLIAISAIEPGGRNFIQKIENGMLSNVYIPDKPVMQVAYQPIKNKDQQQQRQPKNTNGLKNRRMGMKE